MANELIKAGDLGIAALDPDDARGELLAEALAGEKLTLGDFERIKFPTGGGVKFTRTVLGNEELVASIEGVIIHQGMSRAWFSNPEPSEGTQPDCKSPDAKWGYGTPGDELRNQTPPQGCEVCPKAQWGSAPAKDGVEQAGQACKLSRDVFLLTRGGGILPTVVSLPPGSLPKGKGYFVELAGFGIRYYTVVTKLELVKATNKGGTAYAQAKLSLVSRLDEDACKLVDEYRESMLDSIKASVPAEAVEGTAAETTAKKS